MEETNILVIMNQLYVMLDNCITIIENNIQDDSAKLKAVKLEIAEIDKAISLFFD